MTTTATTPTFDRQGYIVIKKNHDNESPYLIAREEWFKKMPLSDTYGGYGQKVSASEACDQLELNTVKSVNAANESYSDEYCSLNETDFEVLKHYAIGDIISAYDNGAVYDYIRANCAEGEDYTLYQSTVLGYTYWTGNNHATITIEVDEWEPSHIRLDEAKEIEILSEFIPIEDNYEFKQSGPASRTATGEKYIFGKSHWQGSWEIATVNENVEQY